MNTVVLNDSVIGPEALRKIESALNLGFETTEVRFSAGFVRADLDQRTGLAEVVAQMLAISPYLVLVDAHMPNQRDGVRVIDALRRAGYDCFAYLWSGGPASDVSAYPEMFQFPGAGGFNTMGQQPEVDLASAVRSSWEKLKGFVLPDARERVLRDPLEAALAVLCEVQSGLWMSELPGATVQQWTDCIKRARDLFDSTPESLCMVASSRNCDGSGLTEALSVLGKLSRAEITDPGRNEELLRKLRDVLLEVIDSCS
jgi:CheY-like chemotaxis protein